MSNQGWRQTNPLQAQRRICSTRALSAAGVSACMPVWPSVLVRRPFIRCRSVASGILMAAAAFRSLLCCPLPSSAAASCRRASYSWRVAALADLEATVRFQKGLRVIMRLESCQKLPKAVYFVVQTAEVVNAVSLARSRMLVGGTKRACELSNSIRLMELLIPQISSEIQTRRICIHYVMRESRIINTDKR